MTAINPRFRTGKKGRPPEAALKSHAWRCGRKARISELKKVIQPLSEEAEARRKRDT
jgi:hypothetical protein